MKEFDPGLARLLEAKLGKLLGYCIDVLGASKTRF